MQKVRYNPLKISLDTSIIVEIERKNGEIIPELSGKALTPDEEDRIA